MSDSYSEETGYTEVSGVTYDAQADTSEPDYGVSEQDQSYDPQPYTDPGYGAIEQYQSDVEPDHINPNAGGSMGWDGYTDDSGHDHGFVGLIEQRTADGGRTDIVGVHGEAWGSDGHGGGVRVDGGVARLDAQQGDVAFQVGTIDGSAELVSSDGYHGVGAQANWVEFSASTGAPGDKYADDDLYLRGGVSLGVGEGVRVYTGTDVDGDHLKEYGFGFDAGPVSADVRWENQTIQRADEYLRETYDEYLGGTIDPNAPAGTERAPEGETS
jgi:hypothetical protein